MNNKASGHPKKYDLQTVKSQVSNALQSDQARTLWDIIVSSTEQNGEDSVKPDSNERSQKHMKLYALSEKGD